MPLLADPEAGQQWVEDRPGVAVVDLDTAATRAYADQHGCCERRHHRGHRPVPGTPHARLTDGVQALTAGTATAHTSEQVIACLAACPVKR